MIPATVADVLPPSPRRVLLRVLPPIAQHLPDGRVVRRRWSETHPAELIAPGHLRRTALSHQPPPAGPGVRRLIKAGRSNEAARVTRAEAAARPPRERFVPQDSDIDPGTRATLLAALRESLGELPTVTLYWSGLFIPSTHPVPEFPYVLRGPLTRLDEITFDHLAIDRVLPMPIPERLVTVDRPRWGWAMPVDSFALYLSVPPDVASALLAFPDLEVDTVKPTDRQDMA